MARILDVVARPEVIIALLELTHREASQRELIQVVESSGIGRIDQATMSRYLGRLEDLDLLEKPSKRGTYRLRFPSEIVALLSTALTLSELATHEEAALESEIGDLLRRSQVKGLPSLDKRREGRGPSGDRSAS